MIAGREYGAGSSDCVRCEAHSTTLTIVECEVCGERGCDQCMVLRATEHDAQTGAANECYLCADCQERQHIDDNREPPDPWEDVATPFAVNF